MLRRDANAVDPVDAVHALFFRSLSDLLPCVSHIAFEARVEFSNIEHETDLTYICRWQSRWDALLFKRVFTSDSFVKY